MGGPQPSSSSIRWRVLQELAATAEPLTYGQLATLMGSPARTIHSVLVRPRRAGWVTSVSVGRSFPNGRALRHTITDLGRKALAEHLEEPS